MAAESSLVRKGGTFDFGSTGSSTGGTPLKEKSFVIVISGTSGAGKTSLIRKTAALLGEAVCLHFDDYRSVSVYPPDLTTWVTSGADPDEWRTPQFAADLRALRLGQTVSLPNGQGKAEAKAYVVVEDPFGRAREEMAASMDFVVYIDLPMEVAMARKLRREVNGSVRDSGPQAGMDHLNDFLSGFLDGSLRRAYLAANASARKSCDLALDGMCPLDDLAQEIVGRVRALRR
jgi:uridine kinase